MPIDKYLEKLEGVRNSTKVKTNPYEVNGDEIQKYIILEGKSHGSYSYPDLLVSIERSHIGVNWFNAHKALHEESSTMLTLRQYVDFLYLLQSGKAFYGNGMRIDYGKLIEIAYNILGIDKLWRSEWLDAFFNFEKVDNSLHINYNHMFIHGQLQAQNSEKLEDYLDRDERPGINLDEWLTKATVQGLPPKGIDKGNLYYWTPTIYNNSVAMFYTGPRGPNLSCDAVPSDSDLLPGIRAAKIKP